MERSTWKIAGFFWQLFKCGVQGGCLTFYRSLRKNTWRQFSDYSEENQFDSVSFLYPRKLNAVCRST
jgi:hypothetical protein